MGIGFDFGPPTHDFDPYGGAWLGERRLSAAHLAELVRRVEARGYPVDDRYEIKVIEADCEHFEFGPTGGHLSKPSRDEDELERQYELACSICEYAGWILVGEGFGFGFEKTSTGYRATTSPPEDIPPRDTLDAVLRAGTSQALEEALCEHEGRLPMDDPRVLCALLLSRDDQVVMDALDALQALDVPLEGALDARLRRVAMLADDPAIAAKANALRQRRSSSSPNDF